MPSNTVPESKIKSQLISIWKELLGVEALYFYHNFFALGGDDFLFRVLRARIKSAFSVDCHDVDKNEFSYLFNQVAFLKKSLGYKLSSIIVPLKSGRTNAPLVFVHPIGGTLFSFMPLIRSLKTDQAVFGIQECFLLGDMRQYASIEEQARYYIEALRPHVSLNEITLLGYSSGGTIASEMARQLLAENIRVSHLVMFDSWAVMPFGLAFRNNFKRIIQRQFQTIKPEQYFKHQCEIDYWLKLLWNRMRLVLTYQPKPCDIEATLFAPEEPIPEYTLSQESHQGWKKLFRNCSIKIVQGNHENMLDVGDIKPISNTIQRLLLREHDEVC